MRPILLLLALVASTFAAPLTGNKITEDGTYTVTTIPGARYLFAVSGDFGGGSLAINWNDGTTSTAYANSPATAAETWTFTAASKTLELVLSDSTDPDLTVTATQADGLALDNTNINAALAEEPVASRAAMGANQSLAPIIPNAAGVLPDALTMPTRAQLVMMADSPHDTREIACIYFNGAYRVYADRVQNAVYDNGYIAMWTTTTEPESWTATSLVKSGDVLGPTGTPGDTERYGVATPAVCIIGSKLWMAYTGFGATPISGTPRATCLASSTDGITFTRHGAIAGSLDDLDGDCELLHDPRTGRTYLYGTAYRDLTRTPRLWYTDDTDLATATWTKHGDCTTGDTGTVLPYAVWIDKGCFWMVAGQTGNNYLYASNDGLSYTKTSSTVTAELHSFLIQDRLGQFAGWGTNTQVPLRVGFRAKAQPYDSSRITMPMSFTGVSASGSLFIAPPRGIYRTIRNIKFISPTTIAASETDYWTFEIRSRTVGGGTVAPTISVDTKAGWTGYTSLPIPGDFVIRDDATLQVFWTKTGAPSNPGFLTLEYTESP